MLPDSLKRTIEDAHRAQFQSFVDASAGHQDAPYAYTLEHASSKRRKTSLDPAAADSLQTEPNQQAVSTNGEFVNYMRELSNSDHNLDGIYAQPDVPSPDKVWNFQGTMQEQWQYHEPGMFAEPLSTIPNATATQEQVYQNAQAPGYLASETNAHVQYQPAKSSFPFSDYLKSSSKVSQDESGNTSHTDHHPEEHERYEQHPAYLGDPLDITTQDESPTLVPTSEATLNQGMPQIDLAPREVEVSPIREMTNIMPLDDSIMPSEPESRGDTIHVESVQIRKSPRQRRTSQASSISISRTSKAGHHKSSSIGEFQENPHTFALPAEQYVPRPSRSRSKKLSVETPIDYSVRPEKAVLQGRRTRTSRATENGSAATTPEKMQKMYDMGFTPTTTGRALKMNNGDLVSSVEWLTNSATGDLDELAAPTSSKSKKEKGRRGRVLGPVTEERIEIVSTNTAEEVDSASINEAGSNPLGTDIDELAGGPTSKSPKVSVVIPYKSKGQASPSKSENGLQMSADDDNTETPKRKTKRRKTAANQSATSDDIIPPAVVKTPATEKKKRGRPKKEAKAKPAEEKATEEESDVILPTSSQEKRAAALQQVQPNTQIAREELEASGRELNQSIAQQAAASEELDSPKTETLPELKNSEGLSEETSEQPTPVPRTLSKTAENTPSPHTKSKINYRVGLSKRARIAPLLRVVKK